MLAKKVHTELSVKPNERRNIYSKYSGDVHSSTMIKLSCALLSSIRTLLPHVGKVNVFCV